MNKVKRAIIMAAGKGTRLHPITLKTPKPLIEVNGKRMIDTVINALHSNGIYEIYVVVGYLKEQFYSLEDQFSGLKIIYNPYYEIYNNISSLYVARDYIDDVIILDSDQIIYNNSILSVNFNHSGYNCVWCERNTNEWLLTEDQGIVTNCSRTGGNYGWQLYSISRWSSSDGKKLKKHLEIEFEQKKNTQIYWDDVALFCYPEEYTLGIKEMKYGDVIEIDNLYELASIDKKYQIYLNRGENEYESIK